MKRSANKVRIGIAWHYSAKFNDYYKPRIDSTIITEIGKFNDEDHYFSLHRKSDGDILLINLYFEKGKVVSNKERTIGYFTVAAGNLVLPLILISSGFFSLGASYLPNNKINANVLLSVNDKSQKSQQVRVKTMALFSGRSAKLDKAVHKFSVSFRRKLLKIDKQLRLNKFLLIEQ
ncbi:hypothetical protein Dfri01_46800 [Dyadobacter frigoris]|nr:hypothetical protein Dfri01_46800 [Dyadobacter frigoris]